MKKNLIFEETNMNFSEKNRKCNKNILIFQRMELKLLRPLERLRPDWFSERIALTWAPGREEFSFLALSMCKLYILFYHCFKLYFGYNNMVDNINREKKNIYIYIYIYIYIIIKIKKYLIYINIVLNWNPWY